MSNTNPNPSPEAGRADLSRRDFVRSAGATLAAAAVPAGVAAAAAPKDFPLAPPDKQPPALKVPPGDQKTVGFAVVGLGQLALEEIMPAFGKCKHAKPVALVSGHPDKAKKTAEFYDIDPKNIYGYDNFDASKDNPAVQVVYVVLPNSMHAEYTVRSFKAGKHVLCEKPMAASVEECQQMIAAGKEAKRKLMIAYRLHYEPFNQTAISIMRSGELGKIKVIEAQNLQNTQAPNIRLSKQTAGGPLGDVGVYCLNAARYLTGEEPVEVQAIQHQPSGDDPRFAEVPESVVFTAWFPSGAMAMCTASFGAQQSRRFRVNCAKGFLDMENAFGYYGQELRTSKGKEVARHDIRPADHFAAEMDHFAQCVLEDKQPKTPGEEGLRDMMIMAKINEAVQSGGRVKVGDLPRNG
jgi:predicted dehydrogenase